MSEEDGSLEISNSATGQDQKWWLPYVTTIIATVVILETLLLIDWSGINSKVTPSWLLFFIWLLVAGKITSFKAFGVELKSAISELSKENIYADSGSLASSKIDYEVVEAGPKVQTSEIPSFIQRGISALYCEIGRKHYYQVNAIADWMTHDFFKWVIFVDDKSRFKGMMPRNKFRAVGGSDYEVIIEKIVNKHVFDLPGFIGQEWALTTTSTKGDAVDKFSNTEVDDLPVVDAANFKFKGVLNRAKLNSKLLASIFRVARAGH